MRRNIIIVPEGVWTKAASSITSGTIRLPESEGEFLYFYTTKPGGANAPVDDGDIGFSLRLFSRENHECISSDYPIDIYVRAYNSDEDSSDSAKIILDL